MDRVITLLLLLALGSFNEITANCPSVCECLSSESEFRVDCSSKRLREIPEGLPGNMTALILSQNSLGDPLVGTDDLQALRNISTLVELQLDGNHIQIIFPEAFLNFTSIRRLQLAQNLLQTISTVALSRVKNLEDLDLSRNLLITLEGNEFSNPTLTKLNLSDNYINSIHGDAFKGLPNLRALHLQGNSLVATNMILQHLTSLKSVDLSRNLIQVIAPGTFNSNGPLESINLGRNNLSYIDPLTFFTLKSLVQLSLAVNHLNSSVFNLLPLKPNLTSLSLQSNRVDKIPRRAFFYNEKLLHIDLSDNIISSIDAEGFIGLGKLETLNLGGNRLTTIMDGTFAPFGRGLGACLVDNPWVCDCELSYLQSYLEEFMPICGEAICSGQGGIGIRNWTAPPECVNSTTQVTPESSATSQFVIELSTRETEEGQSNALVPALIGAVVLLVLLCLFLLVFCLCCLARRQAKTNSGGGDDRIQQSYLDNAFRNSRLSRMSIFWEEDGDGRGSIYDRIKEVFWSRGNSELEGYLEPSRPRGRNSYYDHQLRGRVNEEAVAERDNVGQAAPLEAPAGIASRRELESHEEINSVEQEIQDIDDSDHTYRHRINSNNTTHIELEKAGTIQRMPLPNVPKSGNNDDGGIKEREVLAYASVTGYSGKNESNLELYDEIKGEKGSDTDSSRNNIQQVLHNSMEKDMSPDKLELETYLEPSRQKRWNSYVDHKLQGEANEVIVSESEEYLAPKDIEDQQTLAGVNKSGLHEKSDTSDYINNGKLQKRRVVKNDDFTQIETKTGTIQQLPLPAIPGSHVTNRIRENKAEVTNGIGGNEREETRYNTEEESYVPMGKSSEESRADGGDLNQKNGDVIREARGREEVEYPSSIYADGLG